MPNIRCIGEEDVAQVLELYQTVYGDSYPGKDLAESSWVKKSVFDRDVIWVVAEEEGRAIGAASVMLNVGDPDDLIAQFGRLAVHPDYQKQGIGTHLMEAQLASIREAAEFGFTEVPTSHSGTQKIAFRGGFCAVGFNPLKYRLQGERESVGVFAILLGEAWQLRRNDPRLIAPVLHVANVAMQNMALPNDLLLESNPEPYPSGEEMNFLLDDYNYELRHRLLRIARARSQNPEVFSGISLDYGYLKFKAHNAKYLVAKQHGNPVGAIGYAMDDVDHKLRIFDLLALDEEVEGFLLRQGLARLEQRLKPDVISIDVSAYSPRIQETLYLLEFVPTAYCPAMVFQNGERLDVVKMMKLRIPYQPRPMDLIEGMVLVQKAVEELFLQQERSRVLSTFTRAVPIFSGLSERDLSKVHHICEELRVPAGHEVFSQLSESKAMFVVVEGEVKITTAEHEDIALVRPGEVFGELALIDGLPRSAAAECTEDSLLLVIRQGDFEQFVRQYPRLGAEILRRLSQVLSGRLRESVQNLLDYKRQLVEYERRLQTAR